MTKRILALLLAVVLVLSLFAGCGNKTDSTIDEKETKPSKSDTKKDEEPTTPDVEPEPEPAGPTAEEINSDFDAFCADFLLLCFGDDVYTWNALVADPANFGYERDPEVKAEWYEYCGEYTEESQEYYDELLAAQETFNTFDREVLTATNQAAYDAVAFFFNHSLVAYSPDFKWDLLDGDYISQFGGYVADFSSCVENYKYRTYQDYVDIIDMTASTIDMFPTYLDFAQDRVDAKLYLSDYTIDEMIAYLDGILEAGESYYLYGYYALSAEKACADGILTTEQYAQVVADFTAAMDDCFFPAVESLRNELGAFKGYLKDADRSYTAYSGEGSKYYRWVLEEKLGYASIDMKQYQSWLYNEYLNAYYAYSDAYNALTDGAWEILEGTESFLGMSEYSEMMAWLISAADDVVVPLATTPEISFKDADESVQEFVSYLAYYNLSPLDETGSKESITINPSKFVGDPSNLLDTLAHEGYPGHLYQHVLSKEIGVSPLSMLLSNTGATEGWAQYASYAIFMTTAEKAEQEGDTDTAAAVRFMAAYNYFAYLDAAYMDYLINYEMMSSYDFEQTYGMSYDDVIGSILYYGEMPAGMAPYGYGFAKLVTLHESAKEGVSDYSETAFNAWLLQDGKPYLCRMEELTEQYIAADGKVG